jgi:uncharacterized protein YjiS (DUF1127 family)
MTRIFTNTVTMQRGSPLSQIKHRLMQWRQRARARHELQNLSDRTLRDLGITRCDVTYEASKPFWMS